MIITLHGFGATGEGSKLCHTIHEFAKDHGSLSFTPTYPTNNPHLAHIYLSNYLNTKINDYGESPVLIGFDLGGFWARHLAAICVPKKLILINPDVSPWTSLVPYVGNNKNSGNGQMFTLAINDVAAYRVYRPKKDPLGLKVKLIVSEDDEIFKAQDAIDSLSHINALTVNLIKGGHTLQNDYSEVIQILKDDLFPEQTEA
jgi:predicted esterase YcpF (UPF0227 family)